MHSERNLSALKWIRSTSTVSVKPPPDINAEHEMIGMRHNTLGVIAPIGGDYCEVLRWLRMAERAQARIGGQWVADNSAKRRRLEEMAAKSDAP
jgi:hypothetical protein